nr:ATP-binding cassette domain-containing protein [Halomonas halocynthiae]
MLTLNNAGFTQQPELLPFSDQVRPGELLAIVGPNGAGKSTLLSLLSGFRAPHTGQVCLDNISLTHWQRETLAARRAVVAQREQPVFDWRVKELATLGARASETEARHWMHEMDIAHLSSRFAPTLSGGELQRVMIVRALCQLAQTSGLSRLLLLDEPTSALDIGHQQALMRLLQRLTRQHAMAVVCVLHDINLALRFADRVWLMDQGQRIAAGHPDHVLNSSQLAKTYRVELEDIQQGNDRWLAIKR